jgi:hypothetical protein
MVVSVGQVASHQATAEFQEKPEADRALCGSAHIKAGQDLMGKIGERLKQNPRRKLNGQQQTL